MLLTPEQEQKIIKDNMPKIYRAVDNFMMRCPAKAICIPYDDFVQEVSIAFLEYIRKCESMDLVNRFPWFNAMNAMRRLVLAYQPLSHKRRTSYFSEVIHNMPKTISLDVLSASSGVDVDGMAKHWVDDKDTQMDFDEFMESQTENIRRIASMRVYGMTLQEIGNQCGVSKVAIHKQLNKLNEDYKKYCEEDESDG